MESLEEIYKNSILDVSKIEQKYPSEIIEYINQVGYNCEKKKGLYTVLTTLLYYKYLHKEQDIRLHQTRFEKGFSGRAFDTQHVTPILKKLKLPSMGESGWLTRSLEQPYPYDMKYNGAIGALKFPFLRILDYVERNPNSAKDLLMILLNVVYKISEDNKVTITPLASPENLTINNIVNALSEHFLFPYGTHNGAKLPVLAFFAIYSFLIQELKRYVDCSLQPLSSLTACDRTNKASGDIEIYRLSELFESVEIKLDRQITSQIVRVAEEKIYKWNPQRYYILSVDGILESDKSDIDDIVNTVLENHGCQIIINGLIPTIKYYLRLITNLNDFVIKYSELVENDTELQKIHKAKWNELLEKYQI